MERQADRLVNLYEAAILSFFRRRPMWPNQKVMVMTLQCGICGKKPSLGHQIARRGKAKYLGGVGRKITGISRRRFEPNLQRLQVEINGAVQRMWKSTARSNACASASSASAAAALNAPPDANLS